MSLFQYSTTLPYKRRKIGFGKGSSRRIGNVLLAYFKNREEEIAKCLRKMNKLVMKFCIIPQSAIWEQGFEK